jgi:hypothetical protein
LVGTGPVGIAAQTVPLQTVPEVQLEVTVTPEPFGDSEVGTSETPLL